MCYFYAIPAAESLMNIFFGLSHFETKSDTSGPCLFHMTFPVRNQMLSLPNLAAILAPKFKIILTFKLCQYYKNASGTVAACFRQSKLKLFYLPQSYRKKCTEFEFF